MSGHVFELQPLKRALALVFRREGEIGLADRCGVQGDRDAERTFHADPLAALDIVDIEHGVIAEHGQMHGLAGVVAQLQQMFVGDVADIHLVERAVRDRDQRGAELIGVAPGGLPHQSGFRQRCEQAVDRRPRQHGLVAEVAHRRRDFGVGDRGEKLDALVECRGAFDAVRRGLIIHQENAPPLLVFRCAGDAGGEQPLPSFRH